MDDQERKWRQRYHNAKWRRWFFVNTVFGAMVLMLFSVMGKITWQILIS